MLAITGAGGQLGLAIVTELLQRAPADSVRFGSRTPTALAPPAQVLFADFDDPASLSRLFAGAQVALVISGTAPHAQRVQQHRAAFAAARNAGVQRIVYTSFTGASGSSRFSVAATHAETEQALRTLGTPFTILRNGCYAENIMIEAARATGVLTQPGSAGKVAYIRYADVAAATVGALLGSGHENRVYEVTGPEALNHYEIADHVSAVWKRPIRVEELTPDAYGRGLRARGLPDYLVELLTTLHAAIGAGEYASVSTDAARLAGRAIEPVSGFLARA